MKKFTCLTLSVVLGFAFIGCSKSEKTVEPSAPDVPIVVPEPDPVDSQEPGKIGKQDEPGKISEQDIKKQDIKKQDINKQDIDPIQVDQQ